MTPDTDIGVVDRSTVFHQKKKKKKKKKADELDVHYIGL